LSPACASFDQYRNFEVRGDSFVSLVAALDDIEMLVGDRAQRRKQWLAVLNADRSRTGSGPLTACSWRLFSPLMGIGLMMSFAASPAVAERLGLDSFYFVERHGVFLLPALAAMIGVSFSEPAAGAAVGAGVAGRMRSR
jgi:hypothetical protein